MAATVILGTTLDAARGACAAAQGQFLVLLTIVTFMANSTEVSTTTLALPFLAGGLTSTAIAMLVGR